MRITRVTLAVVAVTIGVGFYQVLSYLLKDVEVQALQAVEEVMVDSSHLLAGIVEGEFNAGNSLDSGVLVLKRSVDAIEDHHVSSKIYQRKKQDIGLGVYVTNSEGIVIYDSEKGKRVGMDFSRLNDVKLTLQGSYGARSTRTDKADSRSSVMYVAAPIIHNGKIVASLSVYKRQEDVREFVEARVKKIVFSTLMIGFGVLALCVAVLIWVYRPIRVLTHYAKAVSAGERLPLPSLGKGYEVNTLGKSLYQMRETLEGRKYVENYVSSMTHELKSPLAGIRAAAELLQEREMPEEQRNAFLQNIEKEVCRGERLVQDLLCLSQLEGMHFLEEKESIDMAELVDGVVCDTAQEAIDKNINIKVERGSTHSMNGDRRVLSLALIHLVRNAIEFSERGSIVLISWKKVADYEPLQGAEVLMISVKDNGVGIPEYAQERVMEHFYSLPRPDGAPKSTGLGLPLVKEATALHQGFFTLKNQETEQGCVAALYLPLPNTNGLV